MTFYLLEVQVCRCDKCGKEEKNTVNKNYQNVIEEEQYFINKLKERGWIYDKENDMHYCPRCKDRIGEINYE